MQKIFQEYGGVITTAMAIVALVSLIGIFFTADGDGWIDNAFHDVVDGFVNKVDEAVPGEGTGGSGGGSTIEPIAYSYNGVELPALPEWDKETYPYAYIGGTISIYDFSSKWYYLYLTDKPFAINSGLVNNGAMNYLSYVCKTEATDLVWSFVSENENKTVNANKSPAVWANYDIQNTDGSVFLPASDPVPVYE